DRGAARRGGRPHRPARDPRGIQAGRHRLQLRALERSLRSAAQGRAPGPAADDDAAGEQPFLDMLVELQWSTGRLVREYTFLLDPPEYKGPALAEAPSAPAPR